MSVQGTTVLDFGAFPGTDIASVVITGQPTILSNSLVEAWIFPATTADHSIDEHLVETIQVQARDVVAGVGFTIYGINTMQFGRGPGINLYGKFNVAWCWN